MRPDKFIGHAKNDSWNVIGVGNSNPIIDTHAYDGILPDGYLQ